MTGQNEKRLRLTISVLLLVYILNFLDRQIVGILAQPIAKELGLSDTQIGLMTGIAFALFYTGLGFPIARFADRPSTSRVRLIALCLTVWSGMTALCGSAQTFAQLFLARMGVGLDNIDVAAATGRGVLVTNVPDYCVEEVSNQALALLLGWARQVTRCDALLRAGKWGWESTAQMQSVHQLVSLVPATNSP